MNVEITVPSEFSGPTLVDINKRNGVLKFQEARDEYTTFVCEVGYLGLVTSKPVFMVPTK